MLEIFNNLRKKIKLAEVEREAPTSRRTNERLFPVFLQIDLQFTLRASQ